jgi:hypothetical protein
VALALVAQPAQARTALELVVLDQVVLELELVAQPVLG